MSLSEHSGIAQDRERSTVVVNSLCSLHSSLKLALSFLDSHSLETLIGALYLKRVGHNLAGHQYTII